MIWRLRNTCKSLSEVQTYSNIQTTGPSLCVFDSAKLSESHQGSQQWFWTLLNHGSLWYCYAHAHTNTYRLTCTNTTHATNTTISTSLDLQYQPIHNQFCLWYINVSRVWYPVEKRSYAELLLVQATSGCREPLLDACCLKIRSASHAIHTFGQAFGHWMTLGMLDTPLWGQTGGLHIWPCRHQRLHRPSHRGIETVQFFAKLVDPLRLVLVHWIAPSSGVCGLGHGISPPKINFSTVNSSIDFNDLFNAMDLSPQTTCVSISLQFVSVYFKFVSRGRFLNG